MDIQRLNYFISVAERLNFTQAARHHHMAQTAMSRHILALEQDLGVLLFLRNNRKVTLTEAGKELLPYAQNIVNRYEAMMGTAKELSSRWKLCLRIGFGPHERSLVIDQVRPFHQRFPEIEIHMNQYGYKDLSIALEKAVLDVIFCTTRIPNNLCGSEAIILCEHRNLYILSKEHPLAKRGVVHPQDFAGLDMAIHYEEDGPYNTKDVLADFADRGISPRSFVQVNSMDAKLALVESCNMVAAIPQFMEQVLQDRFFIFEPPEPNVVPSPYCAAILKKNSNPAVKLFMDVLKNTVFSPEHG